MRGVLQGLPEREIPCIAYTSQSGASAFPTASGGRVMSAPLSCPLLLRADTPNTGALPIPVFGQVSRNRPPARLVAAQRTKMLGAGLEAERRSVAAGTT